MTPLLLDVSHTSHTQARTGIQRVVRSLHAALAERCVPITYDPYGKQWRSLERWELANLGSSSPGAKRGAHWPMTAKWRGRMKRAVASPKDRLPAANSGVVVPELFSPSVATALPRLFAATNGPRVAVFHDAIALQLPEFTPAKTVARFPGYLRELLAFDGIAAVSEDSRRTLLEYWAWLGVRDVPPVRTIPLGVDAAAAPRVAPQQPNGAAKPVVLSVGSIEGRKNHFALLDACEQLWARGAEFELHLVGHAQRETGAVTLRRIEELRSAGRSLRYDGSVADDALAVAYARCTLTVYPSVLEGFGLPVLESIAASKPCICSASGALGEAARGGGCIALATMSADEIAAAIDVLLRDAGRREALAAEARNRKLRTWSEYAAELTDWLRTLPRRNAR